MIGSYGAFIICGVAKRGVFLSALSAVSSLADGTFRSQSNPQHLMCVHLDDSICLIMRASAEAITVINVPNAMYSSVSTMSILSMIIFWGWQASTIYIYESLETSECFGHYIYLVTFLKSLVETRSPESMTVTHPSLWPTWLLPPLR